MNNLSRADRALAKMDDFTLERLQSAIKSFQAEWNDELFIPKKAVEFLELEHDEFTLGRPLEIHNAYHYTVYKTPETEVFFSHVKPKVDRELEQRSLYDEKIFKKYNESHYLSREFYTNSSGNLTSTLDHVGVYEGVPYDNFSVCETKNNNVREAWISVSIDNDLSSEELHLIAEIAFLMSKDKSFCRQYIHTSSKKARAILGNRNLSDIAKAAAFYSSKDPSNLKKFDAPIMVKGSSKKERISSYNREFRRIYGSRV